MIGDGNVQNFNNPLSCPKVTKILLMRTKFDMNKIQSLEMMMNSRVMKNLMRTSKIMKLFQ
jgi:hypothetical protein